MKKINASDIAVGEYEIHFDVDQGKSHGYVYEILKKQPEALILSDEETRYIPPVLILRKRKL